MSSSFGWPSTSGLFDDQDAEDGEISLEQQSQWGNKDSLILAIDCSSSMFTNSLISKENSFRFSVKCAINVLKRKIISSDKDLIGIIFFGTEKQKNPSDFQHVYIYQDLDFPDAQRILDLEKLLDDEDCSKFSTFYGHSSGFSLSDVLWMCSNMFSQSSQKIGHKRVMLFTNCDDPHANRPDLQRQAKRKAQDLSDVGIEIELMHMQPPRGSFDVNIFYRDIISFADDEEETLPDAAEKFEELLTRVTKKDHKKRAYGHLPFKLADGVELGVSIFNLCRPATKSSYINLDSRTNEEVRTRTKYICEDTASELLPTDIKCYQMFGGEKIIFEKEEVDEMKRFGEPGILLMGFKPLTSIRKFCQIKPATFIYPDDKTIVGSRRLFSALLSRCLTRSVVPICRYIPRTGSSPSFVALLPQEEELDEHNLQISPPGFHVIFLPFTDDIRKLVYQQTAKATEEQIEKAKEIIKKLTANFDSNNFENPSLQKHYKNLEALALDRDEIEEVKDLTEPDTDQIDARVSSAVQEFSELVFPDNYNPDSKPAAKRKADGGIKGGATAKRSKAAEDIEINMQEEAKKGRLTKLTVAVLKEFVKKAGIRSGSKKAELIATINEHFSV